MKRIFIYSALIVFFCSATWLLNQEAHAGDSAPRQEKPITDLLLDGQIVAKEVSKAVGVSISPLLGMSALGAYHYWTTPAAARGSLRWHSSPLFWGPLLVILLACTVKDSAKLLLPVPKAVLVPLDALEAVENKISGLIGIFFILSSIGGIERGALTSLLQKSIFSIAYAAEGIPSPDPLSLIKLTLLSTLLLFCFFVVWLVSHTINILILLCPFSSIDFMLKMARNSILAILVTASLIHPYLGLAVSLSIVFFAYLAAGWSFRFMIFGSVFSLDILQRRSKNHSPDNTSIKAFSGEDLANAPAMSYGFIRRTDKLTLEFTYRPWLILPARTVPAPEPCERLELGKGTLSPIVLEQRKNHNSYRTLFRLRPLYKSHEASVARALGITSIRDVGVSRGLKEGWKWLTGLLNPSKKY